MKTLAQRLKHTQAPPGVEVILLEASRTLDRVRELLVSGKYESMMDVIQIIDEGVPAPE